MKKIIKAFSPLLLYLVLFFPYSILNSKVLVNVFGCGCPTVDKTGKVIVNSFNANDFSSRFWSVIIIISTVLSVFLSKNLPKIWMKIIIPILVAIVSVFLSWNIVQMIKWN